jgi:hypothetical protein
MEMTTNIYCPDARAGQHTIRPIPGEILTTCTVSPYRIPTPYDHRPDLAVQVVTGHSVQVWFFVEVSHDTAQTPETGEEHEDHTHGDGTSSRFWFPRVLERTFSHRGKYFHRVAMRTVAGYR